ncbi:hypothetical protein EYF80_054261 [Liparis tanakae]|uniref:Uncharacterized protein n=1 Tax=Liparis tanakae TaxID=230148 RepID=A0A4Z2F3F0_9TELE|nr:hypothetical protein EYF80_054261 [Liparis tanakae]
MDVGDPLVVYLSCGSDPLVVYPSRHENGDTHTSTIDDRSSSSSSSSTKVCSHRPNTPPSGSEDTTCRGDSPHLTVKRPTPPAAGARGRSQEGL